MINSSKNPDIQSYDTTKQPLEVSANFGVRIKPWDELAPFKGGLIVAALVRTL